MKKLTLGLLGLLAFAFCSRADVFVYKLNYSYVVTGHGATFKGTVGGWLVQDPQNGFLETIRVFVKTKEFTVIDHTSDYEYRIISGSPSKQYNVLSLPGTDVGAILLKGLNTTLKTNLTGTTTLWYAPKTMSFSGSNMTPEPDPALEQDNGSITLDLKTTKAHNVIDGDFDATMNRLIQALIAKGYSQTP